MRRCLLFVLLLSSACVDRARPVVKLYEAGDYAGASRAADEGLAQHPDDDGLWEMKIRSALAQGDADAVAKAYATYQSKRGDLDKELIRDLATATLGQALASPSAKLKLDAIDAIEEIEIQALADTVAERMGDEDERVAVTAAVAVLHGGYADPPRVLGAALHADDAEVRRIALDGIGKKIGKAALGDLEEAANDPAPQVRRVAIRWLGQLKDADAVEVLTKRLHDPDDSVRAASAHALAHIGIGDLPGYGKTALADKSLAVRSAGIDLLVSSKVAEADLVALADDPDPLVALEAAIHVKRPDLVQKALERAIGSTEATTRAGAVNYATAGLGKEQAAAFAQRLIGDPDVRVRLAAARVLAHAGKKDAAIAVFAAADGDIQAAADLAELGDPRGSERLDKLVRDPQRSAEERAEAARAHRTAHRVTPGLVAALADSNALVRVEAAAAMGVLAK